ncbi:DNA polymerase III subunit gamma/tau C-terminal domain-containing protein [uncultured Sutterella sp.]|uniref:DNA polymerase III subunit gamma/tau C-terminal domain-containing protein n=1 Tax=uncultured Sutterella sp. TaxID=286133 RepID=UPI0034A075E4
MTGPLKSLASQSQVISLTDARVQLRLGVQSLLTEHNKKLLEERISGWLGRPFRVEFLAGTVEAGSTVADAERRKKEAERRELIEKFKSDPVVQEIVRLFNGKIDEDSIRPLTPEEMAEKD